MQLTIFWFMFVTVHGMTQLLFTTRNDVSIIDVIDPTVNVTSSSAVTRHVLVSGLDDAVAVDYVWAESSVYWTDVSRGRILQINVNKNGTMMFSASAAVEVISTGLMSPDGLACDWVGLKLYWVDSETDRLEVANLDGSLRKVLYWTDLDQPRALALDPVRGYLYWADWGEQPRIERAGMDGTLASRRLVVSHSDIYWPNGLTIDHVTGRIYWTDVKLQYIDSCMLDGTDRRPVTGRHGSGLVHPVTLTASDNTIYWSDWQTHAIYSYQVNASVNTVSVIASNLHMVTDIRSYGPTRQPLVVNPCGANNGGCSHLCLLSPLQPLYKCACPTGVLLLADNKTCADGAEEILLLARRKDVRLISLDTADHTDVVLNVNNIEHAVAIDFDPVDRMVYWTDDDMQTIRRVHLDGTGAEFVINVELDHPDGIAVDWLGRNLYWTDKGMDRIEMSRLNGSSRRVIVTDRLQEPRDIVVDPFNGRIYWTDWGVEAKIESSALDGTDRIVIINTSLVWPNGLAIDLGEHRLYWADAERDQIEMSNLDGSGRQTLISDNIPHVFGLTLLGDFIYWTDWHRRTVERVHKLTGRQRSVIVDQLPDVMGLTAANLSVTVAGVNSCANDNGGCSHLCIHRSAGTTPSCLCPHGMYLQLDMKHCVTPEAFLVYTRRVDIRRLTLASGVSASDEIVVDSGIKQACAIDCHVSDGRIYWTDTSAKTINGMFMNGTAIKRIVQFGLSQPEGLAIDWIARNLYWTDFSTGRIEMSRVDGTSRRVLVWQDAKPRAIVLDPMQGYMYWSNGISSGPRIERATLDGADRQTIVSSTGQVTSLTIDYDQMRLYWASLDCACIETSDMVGGMKQRLVTSLQQPFGITLYGQKIYWTDWTNHAIETANKQTGLERSVVVGRLNFPMDVTVYHMSRQLGWNQCAVNNGRCQHLCIANIQSAGGYHCSCPTHYTLSPDNYTCLAPSSFLLISQQTVISRLPVSDVSIGVDVTLPVTSSRSIHSVTYDMQTDFIYWIDSRSKSVRKARHDGTQVSVLVPSAIHHDITILPYDIVLLTGLMAESLLYWSDAKRNVVSVMRLDGTDVGIIINGSDQRNRQLKPRELALDACVGLLFWTNAGRQARVESSSLDGSSQHTVVSGGIWSVGALAADVVSHRIYWVDTDQQRIESANYDGTNRLVVVEQLAEPVSLAVHGSYLYWADRTSNTLERVNKVSHTDRSVVKARLQHLTDIFAVQRHQRHNSCSQSCLTCSHLCTVSMEMGKAMCACPVGYVLNTDGHTCTEVLTRECAPNERHCAKNDAGVNRCSPVQRHCAGMADCSNEPDCSRCKAEEQFRCPRTGQCIRLSQRCDGHVDCADGADESGCRPCTDITNSIECVVDGWCISQSMLCDNHSDCTDSQDELNCSLLAGNSAVAANVFTDSFINSQHTFTALGSIFGLLIVFVIVLTYLCWRRRHIPQCTSDVCDKAMAADKALTTTTTTMAKFPVVTKLKKKQPRANVVMTCSRSPVGGLRQDNVPCQTYHVSGSSRSTSHQLMPSYPRETLNPPPSPVTSTDRSVFSSVHVTSQYHDEHCQHCQRSAVVLSPCSTDMYSDSPSLWRSTDIDTATEFGGYETEPLYIPPPPTPSSRYAAAAGGGNVDPTATTISCCLSHAESLTDDTTVSCHCHQHYQTPVMHVTSPCQHHNLSTYSQL